jgi:hypothetical protein
LVLTWSSTSDRQHRKSIGDRVDFFGLLLLLVANIICFHEYQQRKGRISKGYLPGGLDKHLLALLKGLDKIFLPIHRVIVLNIRM